MFKNTSVYALATVAALALIGPAQSASAQSSLNDDTQVLISQIQTDKRAVVLKNLALTDDQVRAFTPIYDEYQKERKGQYERGVDLLNKYASNYDSMTDAAAKDIMKDFFKLKDDQQTTLKQFARKFAKVLPEAKVLRLVQIENKLNAILDVQAARIVPLSQ
jgi:Spy/CpxP family protein refolding chaperone